MSRISHIIYLFPASNATTSFFQELAQLLGETPQCHVQDDSITIISTTMQDVLPMTSFRLAEVPFPCLYIDTTQPFQMHMEHFVLTSRNPSHMELSGTSASTAVEHEASLSIPEITARLQGHLTRLDHTGRNRTAR